MESLLRIWTGPWGRVRIPNAAGIVQSRIRGKAVEKK